LWLQATVFSESLQNKVQISFDLGHQQYIQVFNFNLKNTCFM
jgi:hypothetical protein